LLEPSLCHHKVCVLDVGSEFLSLVHVQLLKHVTVKIKKNFLCFLGNHPKLVWHVQSILEMVACYFHFNEKFLYAHQATDLFIQEREKVQELQYLLSHSPNKESVVFHCRKLLLLQLSFGKHNLTYLFGDLCCTPYLENPTTLLSDIRSNFPFGYTKSKAWFHLTRAESQAAMMVSLPQDFYIGLFVNLASWCCGWHN
jgi:hypothetical protein